MRGLKSLPTYLFIFLFMQLSALGQARFHVQAAMSESAGMPIANQIIGVQVEIIQSNLSYPSLFGEPYVAERNGYWVVNLNVGEGIPYLFQFADLVLDRSWFINSS